MNLETDRLPRIRILGMIAVLLPAWIVEMLPSAPALLLYDRTAISHGELWRLLTGHWVHFSPAHLMSDTIAWILALICLPTGCGRRLALAVVLAVGLIPLTLWFAEPDLVRYAGLSGMGMTAWAFVAMDGWMNGSMPRGAGVLISVALLLKMALEATWGSFAWMAPVPDIEPATLAHAVGAVCGTMLCIGRSQGTLAAVQACDEEPSTP